MADQVVMVFDGTPTTVIATTGTIADAKFSVAGTNATHTEFDNSSDLWPWGVATILIPDTWAAAPNDESSIGLYAYRQDVDGSNDELAPDLSTPRGAHFMGSFRVTDEDVAQYRQMNISLEGIRKAKFSIKNNTGQILSHSSGLIVKIEGFSYVPAA